MKDRRERLEEACFRLGSISLGRERTEDELIEALIRQAHVHKDGWLEAEQEFAALIGRKPTEFNSMKNIRDAVAAALAQARAEGMREAARIVEEHGRKDYRNKEAAPRLAAAIRAMEEKP